MFLAPQQLNLILTARQERNKNNSEFHEAVKNCVKKASTNLIEVQ